METEQDMLRRLTLEALTHADRLHRTDVSVHLSAALDALGSEDHYPDHRTTPER